MRGVGITFPEGYPIRQITISDESGAPDFYDKTSEIIIGTPFHVAQTEHRSDPLLSPHEAGHTFVYAHLIPNQPFFGINWDEISDEELLMIKSLADRPYANPSYIYSGPTEVGLQKHLYEINERANSMIASLEQDSNFNMLNPEDSVRRLPEMIEGFRKKDRAIQAYYEVDGVVRQVSFETILARVSAISIKKLKEYIMQDYIRSEVIDLDEAIAQYFALHSADRPVTEKDGQFNQGDRAKRYTLILEGLYPDPVVLANEIESFGFEAFLKKNAIHFDLKARS